MMDLSALDNEFSGMTRSDILRALLEAADDGHADFADVDDGRGRLAASFADDEGEGHWVTMEGEHVFLKGGKIDKGPSNLVGKSPSDLPPRSSGGEKDTHEKTLAEHLNEARAAHKAAVEAAHAAGKPVAGKVLKDYSHLGGSKPAKEAAPAGKPSAHEREAAIKELLAAKSKGEEHRTDDPRGDLKHLPTGQRLTQAKDAISRIINAHVEKTSVSIALDKLHESLAAEGVHLKPEEFRAALLDMHDKNAVRLQYWPRMIDDLPRPDLSPVVRGNAMAYAKMGEGEVIKRDNTASADHAKATKELYDSMGQGSATHGGPAAAHAKIEAHIADLSKLSADKVKESLAAMGLRGGSSKPENLALVKRVMADRMGMYDRVNSQKGHPLI